VDQGSVGMFLRARHHFGTENVRQSCSQRDYSDGCEFCWKLLSVKQLSVRTNVPLWFLPVIVSSMPIRQPKIVAKSAIIVVITPIMTKQTKKHNQPPNMATGGMQANKTCR
jgi:hypothetical protein